jgi:YHS domain-containing protein
MFVRLILWAILGFLVYTIVQAAWRAFHASAVAPPPEKSRGGESMERDPQCGTFVPRGDAVAATVRGKAHWFCSTRCRDEFLHKH